MSVLTAASDRLAQSSSLLDLLFNRLSRIADWWHGRRGLALVLITVCFLPVAVVAANNWPLSNDEIYTFRIAQQPTIHEMIALSQEIDLHPPLHYLAERYSMKLAAKVPIKRDIAARLPSIIAGLIFYFCLFLYAERRLGVLYGLMATGCMWLVPILDWTWSNRPYAMWIAFLWMMLVAVDKAREADRKWWALPAVMVCGAAMEGTQALGALCIGLVLCSEAVRSYRRRRIDWPLVIALVIPMLYAAEVHRQMHALAKNAFPADQQASFALLQQIYGFILGDTLVIATACVFGVLFIGGWRRVSAMSDPTQITMEPEDIALMVLFFVFPAMLFIPASIVHLQIWMRYGMPSMPALGVLLVWIMARRMPGAKLVALIMVTVSSCYVLSRMVTDGNPRKISVMKKSGRYPVPLDKLDPSLPIVVASPMTFVEMGDRESPEVQNRVYYLTDYASAYKYAHYTLFENEDKIARLLGLGDHAVPLKTFLPEHQKFYMIGAYGRPEIWLPRKLVADGWHMTYLGYFVSMYESDDLWMMTKGPAGESVDPSLTYRPPGAGDPLLDVTRQH